LWWQKCHAWEKQNDAACSKKNGYTVSLRHALFAPKGTPREIAGKLNAAARQRVMRLCSWKPK
jgi:hypothetical protein